MVSENIESDCHYVFLDFYVLRIFFLVFKVLRFFFSHLHAIDIQDIESNYLQVRNSYLQAFAEIRRDIS